MATDSKPVETQELDGARIVMTSLEASGADEKVVLENLGSVAQPLNNWVLASLRGDRFFVFLEGTVLPAGGKMAVHSGSGARGDSPFDLIWTQESVWNNKGDTAVLFGAHGHEVARIGNGSRAPKSMGAKMLFRENGDMYIEDSKPHKKVNLGWAAPDTDKDPEGSR